MSISSADAKLRHSPTSDTLPSLARSSSTTSTVTAEALGTRLVLVDWDDTFLCSAFIKNLRETMYGRGTQIMGLPQGHPVWEALGKLAGSVRKTLTYLRENSDKVVLVTNGERGWVEYSTQMYFPQLQEFVSGFEIVSARTQWETAPITTDHVEVVGPYQGNNTWKIRSFFDIALRFCQARAQELRARGQDPSRADPVQLVAIGDREYEINACKRTVDVLRKKGHGIIGKAVKFVECPSPVVLHNEHTSLIRAYKTDVLAPKHDLLLRLVVLDEQQGGPPMYTGDQVDGRMPRGN